MANYVSGLCRRGLDIKTVRILRNLPTNHFRSWATHPSTNKSVLAPDIRRQGTVTIPSNMAQIGAKRSHPNGHGSDRRFKKKQKVQKDENWPDGSHEEILVKEVQELLQDCEISSDSAKLPELQRTVQIEVSKLSSTGDGLAVHKESGTAFVIPFSIPGDVVIAKPFRRVEDPYYIADFVQVVEPSPQRDDSLIKCQYFARCGGCQFQMLSYENQLNHKRTVVEKAYRFFSGLDPKMIPEVEPTMESPLQYGYRTKLTPHFDGPPGRHKRKHSNEPVFKEVPPIGFMLKGTRQTIDIEDCPIGTNVLRRAIKAERKRIAESIHTFKNGATILLRESTERIPKSDSKSVSAAEDQIVEDHADFYDIKSCVTDNKGTSREYVGSHIFTNPAGAFFQNNNSILLPFIDYIRTRINPQDTSDINYLVDAYCGSGLFTVTLSSLFKKSIGIDISDSSVTFARKNAMLNNLPESQATFMTADAAQIFEEITFPADETVVVIDPPRKGCDQNFLGQLLRFGPKRIMYISCNVHTQARDVGVMVNGLEGIGKRMYELESLRGLDFFPQSHHVEGVAILKRRYDHQ